MTAARNGGGETFADYLSAHPDTTVQAAREWLRERAGGPRTLREALDDLDAAGAPWVASLAIRDAWVEWRRTEDAKKCDGSKKKCCAAIT